MKLNAWRKIKMVRYGWEQIKALLFFIVPIRFCPLPNAIKGLIDNAIVKITDISGGLVYQTKALGGQAIWYGRNFNGEKSASGVYLVFCSNDDGSKTFITKILVVN